MEIDYSKLMDKVKTLTIAGGAAGGFVGVAGGVDIGVLDVTVQAYTGAGSTVKAKNDVDVNALSHKNVNTFAVSGAGGFVGVAGSVSVWTIIPSSTGVVHEVGRPRMPSI